MMMLNKINIVVTSGGIISKIDDVRCLGNFSKGTTGALIAEEFLKKGATVHYVCGRYTKEPFKHKLIVNPNKELNQEIQRVQVEYENFNTHSDRLKLYETTTFEEYRDTVKYLLFENEIDAIILSAAVVDYGVKTQKGKISSELKNYRLDLEKNDKIISLVKKWNPKVFQVGFKLLSDVGISELIDTGYKSGIANHSNLTVANSLINGSFKDRLTVFITPEKGITQVDIEDVALKLTEIVTQRISKKHYRTKLSMVEKFDNNLFSEIESFKKSVGRFWDLNLFEPYYDGADMHFGFVAQRVRDNEFLITARGSNKNQITNQDIIYVKNVNFETKELEIETLGKKASLNVNVAAKIFEVRNDVNVIVHSHIFLGLSNRTSVDYSPGTQEDIEEIVRHISYFDNSIELVNHGVILFASNPDEVISALDIEPAYKNFPHLYDLIYGRFQNDDNFIKLIRQNVDINSQILDLAAGTGGVSGQLIENGFWNIVMADKNTSMLNIARQKVPHPSSCHISTYVADIKDMDISVKFDAVVIRQAINYLMDYEGLVVGFSKIFQHLKNNGQLIFNAPNYLIGNTYKGRVNNYELDGWNIEVDEVNILDERILTHAQRCLLKRIDNSEIQKVYDLNRFGMFTKDEFEKALREAGFNYIQFYGNGLQMYSDKSKTLYCVAKK